MTNEHLLPDVDHFLNSAAAIAGLEDYGEPDFIEPMRRFIASCNHDAKLNALGLQTVGGRITNILVNRLRFEDCLKRHPEILDVPIDDPLIIIGLPRVGSTKLHKLLAANPGVHSLAFWQLLNPAPFPGTETAAEGTTIDPRIGIARQISDHLQQSSPDFFAGYIPIADQPEEDQWLLDLTFMQLGFLLIAAAARSYYEWLLEQDMGPAFAYMRKLQQYMIWQLGAQGKPLVLKAPTHSLYVDILARLFPRARFVQPHRNPVECVASVTQLIAAANVPLSDIDHTTTIQRLHADIAIRLANTSAQLRDVVGEARFLDVDYTEVRDDALGIARRIHEFWGVPLDAAGEAAIVAWEIDNPQHKYGEFSYSIAESVVAPAEILARTRPYLERFLPRLATQ